MRSFLVSIQKEDKFYVARCPELGVRQKGSHVSLQKITQEATYRTVVPLHQELAKGTLIDILHQTGLSREDLLELL